MGVDISHIIRHDFRSVHDKEKSLGFVKKTIEQLKRNLCISATEDEFEIYQDDDEDGPSETTFTLPIYDVEFTLHNGFWQIESYYHYCQIVMHYGEYFWLRRLTFDIAKALDQEEAWYAEEFYTWNSDGCSKPEDTFEKWMDFSVKKYGGKLPEYDQAAIMAQGDVLIPNYEPIYHDSFKECKELYDTIQSKLNGFRLLGLQNIGNGYLRCEKEGSLYLINEETMQPMFNEPIEGMEHSLNGPEFIVKKGGLSAVFDMDGNQLTEFVKGRFDWKWANSESRIIYNEDANIELKPR